MTRLLRRPEVQQLTGLPVSSLYGLMARGRFPKGVKLSAKAVGWPEDEVRRWIEERAAERDRRSSKTA